MNVQSFLRAAMITSMPTLGSEPIIIGGTTIQAIIDETTSSNPLGIAASQNERMIVVKFPATAYTGTIKSGTAVTARGLSWQVSSDPESIRKGQVATTLTLVEPNRRSE